MLECLGHKATHIERREREAGEREGCACSMVCYDDSVNCMEPTAMEWRERISVDPVVCHGQACIEGTRMPVAVVLDNLAAGLGAKEMASYPPLRVEDIRAATAYVAELARERIVEIGHRGAA